MTKDGYSERDLYKQVVEIPTYDSRLGQLLDREDEEELVVRHFDDFRELYRPIIQENFKDCFEID